MAEYFKSLLEVDPSTIPISANMEEQIKTYRGEVLGIGKFKVLRTPGFDFIIPMLSFLVMKEPEGGYVSTCIHLQTDGYGKTEQDAILDMLDSVTLFLRENFTNPRCKDSAWVRFEELLYESTHQETELWDAYHRVQVRLSIMGIPTDNTEEFSDWIKQVQTRVKDAALLNTRIGYTPLDRRVA